jgi:squalene monooxygenase
VGVGYREKDQAKEVYAPLSVLVDGCYSNFRSKIGAGKPETKSYFVGVIIEDCKLPYTNHGNVFLASPGPVLGYQVIIGNIKIFIYIDWQ